MFEFLTAAQNTPFAVALALLFGIALLEGITAFFGAALSDLITTLLPEMPDVDAPLNTRLDSGADGVEVQSPNALSRFLGWLRIGQVPVLMLIVVFLTGFGLIGLGIQSLSQGVLGFYWPASLAAIFAFVLSLPVVRLCGRVLAKIMPKDETDAVPMESLVGLVATITIGKASAGRPAEAKVRDVHGTTHYLMVEPDDPAESFNAGEPVLLIRLDGHRFKAITNPNPSLMDRQS